MTLTAAHQRRQIRGRDASAAKYSKSSKHKSCTFSMNLAQVTCSGWHNESSSNTIGSHRKHSLSKGHSRGMCSEAVIMGMQCGGTLSNCTQVPGDAGRVSLMETPRSSDEVSHSEFCNRSHRALAHGNKRSLVTFLLFSFYIYVSGNNNVQIKDLIT